MPQTFSISLRTYLLICAYIFLGGCVSTETYESRGIQAGHEGYIPARIAVLPCRAWPDAARHNNTPLTNIGDTIRAGFCSKFDEWILDSFKDQPYMRGFSPKGVIAQLDKANAEGHLNNLDLLWSHRKEDCNTCPNESSFYSRSIAERVEWIDWLQTLSQSVRRADATLVPFVVYVNESTSSERGMKIALRTARVAILLISTDSGSLLWAGERTSSISNRQLKDGRIADALEYPEWNALQDRLFVEDVWFEFPGRQTF